MTKDDRELISWWEQRLDSPSAAALAAVVGRSVREGLLEPGARMPPIRAVARELAVSPTTVSAAWSLLGRAGMLRTDGRRGTTVLDVVSPAGSRYRRALAGRMGVTTDLSTGVPDAALLPSLRTALAEVTTAGTPASYLDPPVLPELRDALAERWPHPVEELLVVDGVMDALELLVRTRVLHGDRVAVEHPAYTPTVDLVEAAGAVVVPVPLDEEGLRPEALQDAVRQGAGLVITQPRAQNPTGVTTSPRRLAEISEIVQGTGVLVVEDDSAGDLAATSPVSLGSALPEQTVHVRGFSKAYGPDLRLAAMSGPAAVLAAVQGRRQLGQVWTSRLLQRLLLHLLTDPRPQREVTAARATYAERRAALVSALADVGIEVGGVDGINVWVPVADETATCMRLAAQGVAVTPGRPFCLLGDGGHVRVTAGLVPVEDAEPLARLLADARGALWHR